MTTIILFHFRWPECSHCLIDPIRCSIESREHFFRCCRAGKWNVSTPGHEHEAFIGDGNVTLSVRLIINSMHAAQTPSTTCQRRKELERAISIDKIIWIYGNYWIILLLELFVEYHFLSSSATRHDNEDEYNDNTHNLFSAQCARVFVGHIYLNRMFRLHWPVADGRVRRANMWGVRTVKRCSSLSVFLLNRIKSIRTLIISDPKVNRL